MPELDGILPAGGGSSNASPKWVELRTQVDAARVGDWVLPRREADRREVRTRRRGGGPALVTRFSEANPGHRYCRSSRARPGS